MSRGTPDCIPEGAGAFGSRIGSSISVKIVFERFNFSLTNHINLYENIGPNLTLNQKSLREVFNIT